MSKKVEKAAALFEKGFNCAQAVACGCGQGLGLERKQLLAIAGAFGGGMGSTGRVCGAVTGAIMVIGLRCPRLDPKDPIPKQESTRLTRELIKRFEARNGSIQCKDLLGYDLSIPEEAKKAQEQGLFRTKCPLFVKDAAEILEELR
ncbi:C-GCAxxG-C-C family protein [bacterium]|nr:C-GCAxxG-C-C family protein [bacterium]